MGSCLSCNGEPVYFWLATVLNKSSLPFESCRFSYSNSVGTLIYFGDSSFFAMMHMVDFFIFLVAVD